MYNTDFGYDSDQRGWWFPEDGHPDTPMLYVDDPTSQPIYPRQFDHHDTPPAGIFGQSLGSGPSGHWESVPDPVLVADDEPGYTPATIGNDSYFSLGSYSNQSRNTRGHQKTRMVHGYSTPGPSRHPSWDDSPGPSMGTMSAKTTPKSGKARKGDKNKTSSRQKEGRKA